MSNIEINDTPEWQMDDAYGSLTDDRWLRSKSRVKALTADIADMLNGEATDEILTRALSAYEEALTLQSSMWSFAKCLGAKDVTDASSTAAMSMTDDLKHDLEAAAAPLFAALAALSEDAALWQEKPFSHWKFSLRERFGDWHNKLSESDASLVSDIELKAFMPLGTIHKSLQKLVDFEAKSASGEAVRVRAAKLIAILKGDPDPVLRRTTGEAMDDWYRRHADLYAALLNELHGIRLAGFDRAGVTDPLSVSLAQNRMSREALDAIRTAIFNNIGWVREGIRLRAKVLGTGKLGFYDIMAPAPEAGGGVPRKMSYAEGIAIVKDALGRVNPAMSEFIDMMLEKKWLDARPSDKKVGGAFYSRFNEFRIPRVFSTYLGSITAVLQQGHELGHAFHYWTMRDLPMIETEFPMTLTETASNFNEAVIRKVLLEEARGDERFKMLWQESRSGANFLLNTMVRMEFELAFLEERRRGVVPAERCCSLMTETWRRWYGEDVTPDTWLWAHKLHYYKTDQFIYNYPYTVGYLMSQALMREWEVRGDAFYAFYTAMLRDTGRMTVDEIIRVHFGADAADPAFWEGAMQSVKQSSDDFARLVAEHNY